MPFNVPESLQLLRHDMSSFRSVFYVVDARIWRTTEAGGIVVTDRIEIPRFDFE